MKLLSTTADVPIPPALPIEGELGDGRYRLLDALGQGGMGTVYSARDLRSDRVVALKLLRGVNGQTLYRLKHEFRTLTDLQHRNIIVPYELFFHEQTLCYSMELVHGETIVDDCLGATDRPGRLRETLLQLTDALDAVHGRGIIHRDLKPENILVAEQGRVVLLDFGISKTLSENMVSGITMERAWLGTPAYMAPEQFDSATASMAADLYALGTVIFECATGRQAFPQSNVRDLIDAKRSRRLPTTADLGDFQDITLSLLDPDPDQRLSAHQVRQRLHESTIVSKVEARRDPFCVGRRRECKLLLDAVRDAAGRRRVHCANIRGEAGIGKSHLLETFAVKSRRNGAFVASARCSPLESLPLRIIDSLLDDVISQSHLDERIPIERCYPRHAAQMCAVFPCTAVLFGDQHAPAANSETEGERELALRAVSDFLARLSEHVAVVLCFDDLHRSDEDGLDALLRLVLDLSECPITFVFASTPDTDTEPRGIARFVERCEKYAGGHPLTSVTLDPMPTEQLIAIAWNELGSWDGPSSVVETLCEQSSGNAGMCVWYARALVLADENIAGIIDLGPASLCDQPLDQKIFRRAWDKLSAGGRALLTYLALARGELPRSALRTLMGTAEEVDGAMLDLEHAGFLRRNRYTSTTSVCLWHDRIATDVLNLVGDAVLARSHADLARAFAQCGAHGRAADHARARADDATALQQYELAADKARRGHAHRQAIDFLRAALELTRAQGPTTRVEVALADSLSRVGHLREAAELCTRCSAEMGEGEPAASSLRQQAIGLYGSLADVGQVKSLLRETLPHEHAVPVGNRALLARLIGLRLLIWVRPPWKAERPEVPPLQSRDHLDALWTAGSRLLHVDPIFATTATSEHMRLAFRTEDLAHQARALAFEAVIVTSNGEKRLTEASTLLAAAERRANRCKDSVVRAFVHQGAGFMWGNVGRYREAIAEGRRCIECLEHAPDPPAYELGHAHVELGWRLTMIGELAELLSTVPTLLRHAIECEDPVLATAFEVQLAMAHLAADRPEEARTHLESARGWCPRSYEVGHFGIFVGTVILELYDNRLDELAAYIDRTRPEIEKLRLLKLPAVRAIYRYRVASVLLRLICEQRCDDPVGAHRQLKRLRRLLGRETFGVAIAHSRLLDAGCEYVEGNLDRAIGLLREAVDRFAALGWDNISTHARIEYLNLQGAPSDPAQGRVLDQLGVRSPRRWSRASLPPFGRSKPRSLPG